MIEINVLYRKETLESFFKKYHRLFLFLKFKTCPSGTSSSQQSVFLCAEPMDKLFFTYSPLVKKLHAHQLSSNFLLTIGQAIACSLLVKQLHAHHWSSNCMLTIGQAIACLLLVKQLHAHHWSNNCMLTIGQAIACSPLVKQLHAHH
jgi:hypothetical protein